VSVTRQTGPSLLSAGIDFDAFLSPTPVFAPAPRHQQAAVLPFLYNLYPTISPNAVQSVHLDPDRLVLTAPGPPGLLDPRAQERPLCRRAGHDDRSMTAAIPFFTLVSRVSSPGPRGTLTRRCLERLSKPDQTNLVPSLLSRDSLTGLGLEGGDG